jgi:hypothetical protein
MRALFKGLDTAEILGNELLRLKKKRREARKKRNPRLEKKIRKNIAELNKKMDDV